MFNIEPRKKLVYLVLHLLLGIVLYKMPLLSTYLGLAIMVFATYMILSRSDENETHALVLACRRRRALRLLRSCRPRIYRC